MADVRWKDKAQLVGLAGTELLAGTSIDGGAKVGGGTIAPGADVPISTGLILATAAAAAEEAIDAAIAAVDLVNSPSNSSGTVTLDFAGKSRYVGTVALSANATLAFANLPGAGKYAEYELDVAQDDTGGWTLTIPASHKPIGASDTAIASAANAVTVLTGQSKNNGTTWRYTMQESA